MMIFSMRRFAQTSLALRFRSVEMINDIIADLNAKDKNASMSLAKSLRFSISHSNSMISVSFRAKSHWKFVDKGRKPGKFVPIKPLVRWARVKLGLSGKEAVSAAFAISKSIQKKGIKGTNIFTNNINKFKKDIQKLRSKEMAQDVSAEIRRALTTK